MEIAGGSVQTLVRPERGTGRQADADLERFCELWEVRFWGLSQKQYEPLRIFRQRRDVKYLDFYKISLAAVWRRG